MKKIKRRGILSFKALLRFMERLWSAGRSGLRAFAGWWSGSLLRRCLTVESLKGKLILGASTLAVVILSATYMTLSRTGRQAAAEQAEKHAGEVLRFFTDAIAEAVAAGDRMQVHLISQALEKNGAHAIAIRDQAGNVIYASKDFRSPGLFDTKHEIASESDPLLVSFIRDDGDYLHAAKRIQFGGVPCGTAYLRMNQTELEERIERANVFVYPIFAGGYLFLVLLGTVVLCTPFRVLKKLTVSATQIESGDLRARVPVKGHDEVATFCRAFNSMVEGLDHARSEISRAHLEMIQAMVNAVEAKDKYTEGHCLRVREYTKEILRYFEALPPEQGVLIETAALLHDLGKIGITDCVLQKAGKLTKKETKLIQDHVNIGENILRHMDSLKEVRVWVRHHHERWDGLGYPDGLRGSAIPFASRVIAVADTIDAMMTDRPYRGALTKKKVADILRKEKDKQFDPDIADCAIAFLEGHGHGERVDSKRCETEVSTESCAVAAPFEYSSREHRLQIV